jgi:ribonuclease HI
MRSLRVGAQSRRAVDIPGWNGQASVAMDPASKTIDLHVASFYDLSSGRGGFGAILVWGPHDKEVTGGFLRSTRLRMALWGAIEGLDSIHEQARVILHSPSESLLVGIISRSQRGRGAENRFLWSRLLNACSRHVVACRLASSDDEVQSRCHALALKAAGEAKEEDLCSDATEQTTPAKGHRAKIVKEGQPCRKCGTPVERAVPRKRCKQKKKSYYYEFYFSCPNCKTIYMTDEAKRFYETEEATVDPEKQPE